MLRSLRNQVATKAAISNVFPAQVALNLLVRAVVPLEVVGEAVAGTRGAAGVLGEIVVAVAGAAGAEAGAAVDKIERGLTRVQKSLTQKVSGKEFLILKEERISNASVQIQAPAVRIVEANENRPAYTTGCSRGSKGADVANPWRLH